MVIRLFPSRIRPNVFSWRSSSTAITRIREAVSEIKTVARSDAATAAEGAIRLIERISPALEHVDSSSGALGSAVNGAIEALVPLISAADVPDSVRQKWLERLYEAHAADQVPYIKILADHWGELCATSEIASAWADRLIDVTRAALGPDKGLRGHFHGTTACLSALLHAGRFKDIYSLLAHTDFWHYKCYAARALAAEGKHDEAIALAESLRGPWTPDRAVDRLCEQILLNLGRVEEAYRRFGLAAHGAALISRGSALSPQPTRASRAKGFSATSFSSRPATKANGSLLRKSCACMTWRWSSYEIRRAIRRL